VTPVAGVGPDLRQLRAYLEMVAARYPDRRPVGIHAPPGWQGPEELEVAGIIWRVRQAPSVLAARELLEQAEEDGVRLVLLTELPESELGEDLCARLVKQRLLHLDAWESAKARFKAREVDPRLLREPHLARHLLEYEPPEGYEPVPAGLLSADIAWSCLLRFALGLDEAKLDLAGLLRWTQGDGVQRYLAAPLELRASATARLRQVCGGAASLVLGCVDQGRAADAVPLGLLCHLLSGDDPQSSAERRVAAARLERYVGQQPLREAEAREWGRAAVRLVEERGQREEVAAGWLLRADEILAEIGAQDLAFLSDLSPRGYRDRLVRFAAELSAGLASGPGPLAPRLEELAQKVLQHREARRRPVRAEQIEMAVRLARWLEQAGQRSWEASPGQMADWYVREGSFVDWARARLFGAESIPELASVRALLAEKVEELRERQNFLFAQALSGETPQPEVLLPIEEVLARVVAPLAAATRVLLVLLDGASWGVVRELVADLGGHGWREWRPQAGDLPPVLTAFPSVTEVCRASLLCGRLQRGSAPVEAAAFAQNPALRGTRAGDSPPLLFHRADVEGTLAGGLPSDLVRRIESERQRVVGVVIHAVDDYLARDTQLHIAWKAESIRPLLALLDHAGRSRRAVVLASDHGHVLERGSRFRAAEGGDRWRLPGGALEEGEVELRGPRVLAPQGEGLVLAWSEKLRYGQKKCGYHGGVSLQEGIAPLVVLAPAGLSLPGWVQAPSRFPDWWQARAAPAAPPAAPAVPPRRLPTKEQLHFWPAAGAGQEPGWLERLMSSPVFPRRQLLKELPEEELRGLLTCLSEGQGRHSLARLSHRLNISESHLRERLELLTRALNLDGFRILALEGDAVALDIPLLEQRFRLRGQEIRVCTPGGQKVVFWVAFEASKSEVKALECLARFGRLSEKELSRLLGSRRVAGLMENLLQKLHAAGQELVVQEGEGPEGRLYLFRRERLQ
jgi:hypothetical protein